MYGPAPAFLQRAPIGIIIGYARRAGPLSLVVIRWRREPCPRSCPRSVVRRARTGGEIFAAAVGNSLEELTTSSSATVELMALASIAAAPILAVLTPRTTEIETCDRGDSANSMHCRAILLVVALRTVTARPTFADTERRAPSCCPSTALLTRPTPHVPHHPNGHEPIIDVDQVEAIEYAIRSSEPGRYHVDGISAAGWPHLETVENWDPAARSGWQVRCRR